MDLYPIYRVTTIPLTAIIRGGLPFAVMMMLSIAVSKYPPAKLGDTY